MPTSDDYRQMANRAAQIAIGCSAPSVARALLALLWLTSPLLMGLARPRLTESSNSKKCKKTLLAMEIRPAVCASNARVRA